MSEDSAVLGKSPLAKVTLSSFVRFLPVTIYILRGKKKRLSFPSKYYHSRQCLLVLHPLSRANLLWHILLPSFLSPTSWISSLKFALPKKKKRYLKAVAPWSFWFWKPHSRISSSGKSISIWANLLWHFRVLNWLNLLPYRANLLWHQISSFRWFILPFWRYYVTVCSKSNINQKIL